MHAVHFITLTVFLLNARNCGGIIWVKCKMLNKAAISFGFFPLSAISEQTISFSSVTLFHITDMLRTLSECCVFGATSLLLVRTFVNGLTHTSDTPLFLDHMSGALRT